MGLQEKMLASTISTISPPRRQELFHHHCQTRWRWPPSSWRQPPLLYQQQVQADLLLHHLLRFRPHHPLLRHAPPAPQEIISSHFFALIMDMILFKSSWPISDGVVLCCRTRFFPINV